MTMQGFFDPRQLDHAPLQELHNGAWTSYAECPARATNIAGALEALARPRDFGRAPIARIHDADYLAFLQSAHDEWRAAGRDGGAIGCTWPVVARRKLN